MNQTSPPKFFKKTILPVAFLQYAVHVWLDLTPMVLELGKLGIASQHLRFKTLEEETAALGEHIPDQWGPSVIFRESNATRREGSDRRLAKVVAGLGMEKRAAASSGDESKGGAPRSWTAWSMSPKTSGWTEYKRTPEWAFSASLTPAIQFSPPTQELIS